jgi:uncharacterized membrane protein YcaP (DUF421 family)
MDDPLQMLSRALGLMEENGELNAYQMALRAVVVYVVTIAIVRVSKKRFMSRATAFDVILGIILGSVASRAITGNAPLVPALVATATLLAIHWLFSGLALQWHGFGTAIKGRSELIITNGVIDTAAMRRAHLTDRDLWEALRGHGISRLEQVHEAHLERSGELSVIRANS